MTISALAKYAKVSPQTVYNSIGGKADVVKAVYDVMLAGDDEPVPMSARPEFREVIESTDPHSYGAAYAAWSRRIYERVGGLLGMILAAGGAGDHDVIEFVARINRERRIGNTSGLTGIRSHYRLSDDEFERVVDGVWALTAPEIYDRLVRQSHWTANEYEAWLANQLAASVGAISGTPE